MYTKQILKHSEAATITLRNCSCVKLTIKNSGKSSTYCVVHSGCIFSGNQANPCHMGQKLARKTVAKVSESCQVISKLKTLKMKKKFLRQQQLQVAIKPTQKSNKYNKHFIDSIFPTNIPILGPVL